MSVDIYETYDKSLFKKEDQKPSSVEIDPINISSGTIAGVLEQNVGVIKAGKGSNVAGINPGTTADDIAFWAGATVENKSSAPFRVTMDGDITATSATLSGYVVSSKGAFGGNGSDGALSVTSGTTTLDINSAAIFIKNYTSVSITGGKLAFSNPNSSGSYIFLKTTGAFTVTSSNDPAIDARGMGGNADTDGTGILSNSNKGVAGTSGGFQSNGSGGAGGAAITASTSDGIKFYKLWCGAGGATGADGSQSGSGGTGGRGGAALVIECAGAYNVTGKISVDGNGGGNGTVGIPSNNDYGNAGGSGGGGFVTAGSAGSAPSPLWSSGRGGNTGGGGGGGSGGTIIALYNTLTADSGTYSKSGGSGGSGGTDQGSSGSGGAGGNGYSLVQQNTNYA